MLVILVTVAIQSLWNGGVGQVCEAFKRKIFNQGRSLPAEEDESQTEFPVPAGEGSVEERPSHVHPAASSRGEDGSGVEERPLAQLPLARQPGPGEDGSGVEERPLAQLPEAVHADEDGLEGHADPLVQLAAVPTPDAALGQTGQVSSSSESSSDDLAGRIEQAIQQIAMDEVALWEHYRRNGHFPPAQEDHSAAELGFDVYRTPYGTVYHSTRACTQLQGPRTGFARQFLWCELCKEVAMRTRGRPPSGAPLLLLTSGQTLHTDSRCPRSQNTTGFRGCFYCTEFNS